MLRLWNLVQAKPDIFDGIVLPEGLDHDDVVNAILLEGADLPPIYGDPALFQEMSEHYFRTRFRIHAQLVELVSIEYDPISNYDRIEESEEREVIEGSRAQSTTSTSEGSASREVSAYNADTMQPSDASSTSGSASASGEESEARDITRGRSSRIKGNIGVVTSQQMLESSYELMGISDVYRYISRDFIHTMLITVY